MSPLSLSQIAKFAGAKLESGDGNVRIDKISTDSRTLKRGELFVALRGENFDGHQFVEAAAKSGALGLTNSRLSEQKILCAPIKPSLRIIDALS